MKIADALGLLTEVFQAFTVPSPLHEVVLHNPVLLGFFASYVR